MGNRAVITTAPFKSTNIGVYLHWNGGRASVEGFLLACKELGFRDPVGDPQYGFAYLCHAIATFFDASGTSLGVAACKNLDCDNGDNGVYLIDRNWEIVGRKHFEREEETDAEQSREMADLIIAKVNAAKKAERTHSSHP